MTFNGYTLLLICWAAKSDVHFTDGSQGAP